MHYVSYLLIFVRDFFSKSTTQYGLRSYIYRIIVHDPDALINCFSYIFNARYFF